MKYLFFFLSLMPCLSMAQNQLVGEWHYDSERTLSELDLSNESSKTIKKCYELKACGNVFFVFDDKYYVSTHFMISRDSIRSYFNYKVVSSNAESITILQKPIDYGFYSELEDNKSEEKINELNVLIKKANDWDEDGVIESFESKFFVTDDRSTLFLLFPEGQKEYFYRKIN